MPPHRFAWVLCNQLILLLHRPLGSTYTFIAPFKVPTNLVFVGASTPSIVQERVVTLLLMLEEPQPSYQHVLFFVGVLATG